MNIEIPVLVEPDAKPEEGGSVYRVRPLFFAAPERTDRTLATALARLAESLEKQLDALGRDGEHRQLAAWSYSPDLELHWLELRLDLRGEMFRGHFPVVTFRQLERTLAFSPRLDEAWFEVPQITRLAAQATEVYSRWFRAALKQRDEQTVRELLGRFENNKSPWITLVELSVTTRMDHGKSAVQGLAMLDGPAVGSGAEELEAVGRCQDHLYPDGLGRAECRDGLVEEVERLLESGNQRPLLLVGPPMVGKTTLVHEFIYRRAERRAALHETPLSNPDGNVWLLDPQRLISGMSYVGQWENRLLAILKEAQKRRYVLYFDDLPGLYHAGVTSQSTLSVADVLKPYVERRDVRVLAEATPEQFRVFRERDQGFADLFQVIRVEQPGEEQTLRILLSVVRMLESRYGVWFALDVLPAVLELTRCWQPEAAFPGKVAGWLNRLAMKYQGANVGRDTVLAEFHAASGVQVAFADTRTRLPREDILKGLRNRIIGQTAAVESMADVVCVAKARLNDRQRPLGTLFFLGPTGVGKTECAKALTEYLFGDAARLVRFDMNEFVSPQSVARLAGTFDQPEGLLTGAVRRQPFCVLLLDEIEKAHPDVFDLLLQILGEARLTDALGRTASFANAVIIVTSNLGTRQAARDVGFAPGGSAADEVYLKAVEEFFRPEFLNRLDRIVPFRRLEREELELIARSILADVVGREGLTRRKCAIELAGDALKWVVDRGYHRTLGARAMRRAVERDLVRPMAGQLAAIAPDTPTVLIASCCGEALAVRVVPLAEVPRKAELARPERIDDPQGLLARARVVLDRLQPAYEAHRPPLQDAEGRISPRYHWYLAVTEFLRQTRALVAALADELKGPHRGGRPPLIHPKYGRARFVLDSPSRRMLKEIYAARDVVEYVRGLAAEMERQQPSERENKIRLLLDRLALADALSPAAAGWPAERALVLIRSMGEDGAARSRLASHLAAKYSLICPDLESHEYWDEPEMAFGLEFTYWERIRQDAAEPKKRQLCECGHMHWTPIPQDAAEQVGWSELSGPDGLVLNHSYLDVLLAEGYRARHLLRYESGTHLFIGPDGRLEPVQAVVMPLAEGQSAGAVLLDVLHRHHRAVEAVGHGEAVDDPLDWRPTISVHGPDFFITDLQSGVAGLREDGYSPSDRQMMASIPLPPEFRDLLDLRGKH